MKNNQNPATAHHTIMTAWRPDNICSSILVWGRSIRSMTRSGRQPRRQLPRKDPHFRHFGGYFLHIYIYIYMYIYIYIYIYIYTYICIYICVYINIYFRVLKDLRWCIYIYKYIYTYIDIYFRVLKDLRWCIRHHSSVEKSAGLDKIWVIRRSTGSIPAETPSTQINMDLSQ